MSSYFFPAGYNTVAEEIQNGWLRCCQTTETPAELELQGGHEKRADPQVAFWEKPG